MLESEDKYLTTEMIRSSFQSAEPNRAEFDGCGSESQNDIKITDANRHLYYSPCGLPWDSENL